MSGAEAGFFIYRMTFPTEGGTVRSTTGVLGALGIDPEEVLPHEQTTPKDKHDRLSLLRAARTNFSPIWGLSTAAGLGQAAEAVADGRLAFRRPRRRRRPSRVMAGHRRRRDRADLGARRRACRC